MEKPKLDLGIAEMISVQGAVRKRIEELLTDERTDEREYEWLRVADTKIENYYIAWEEWMKS